MHSDNTGWSTTRGITNLDKDDFQDEFGQHSHVMNADHPTLTDLVRKQPCDKESPNMQELTSSWLNDPNAKDVNNRLNSLDKETWASSAKQASTATIREFLTDTINEEMDKFQAEKEEDERFDPIRDRVIHYTDDDYKPPDM